MCSDVALVVVQRRLKAPTRMATVGDRATAVTVRGRPDKTHLKRPHGKATLPPDTPDMGPWSPGTHFSAVLLRTVILILCGLQAFVLATAAPTNARTYTIHWNSTNPIFRIDNTDHIIDVNRNNLKFEYDQVNLICPVYTSGMREDEMEKYIIYNVSKDEYETCRITNPNPRIIAVCDKPNKLMYFTITFRPFTPQPGGLEFLPGHDYYFISTSTPEDLHRRIGGRCSSNNMKVVFKVWGMPSQSPTTTPATMPPVRPTWWAATTAPPPRPPPPTAAPTMAPPARPSTTKKSKAYNKHPNEVVKSEELTLGGAGVSSRPMLVVLGVATLGLVAIWR